MEEDELHRPKFKIKSLNYLEDIEPRRFLFTLEEEGVSGEIRKFAEEITEQHAWKESFSEKDVAKILYVMEHEADY